MIRDGLPESRQPVSLLSYKALPMPFPISRTAGLYFLTVSTMSSNHPAGRTLAPAGTAACLLTLRSTAGTCLGSFMRISSVSIVLEHTKLVDWWTFLSNDHLRQPTMPSLSSRFQPHSMKTQPYRLGVFGIAPSLTCRTEIKINRCTSSASHRRLLALYRSRQQFDDIPYAPARSALKD